MDYKPPPPYDPPPAKVTFKMDREHAKAIAAEVLKAQAAQPKRELSKEQQLRATNAELGISAEASRRYILLLEAMLTKLEPDWNLWVDGNQAKKGIAAHHAQLRIANDRAHDATKRATEMHAQITDMREAQAKEIDAVSRSWRRLRDQLAADYKESQKSLRKSIELLKKASQLSACNSCGAEINITAIDRGDWMLLQAIKI